MIDRYEEGLSKLIPVDNINPGHYRTGRNEVITYIEYFQLGFHLGNAVKYVARAGKKHNDVIEDLKKAQWYIERFRSNNLDDVIWTDDEHYWSYVEFIGDYKLCARLSEALRQVMGVGIRDLHLASCILKNHICDLEA